MGKIVVSIFLYLAFCMIAIVGVEITLVKQDMEIANEIIENQEEIKEMNKLYCKNNIYIWYWRSYEILWSKELNEVFVSEINGKIVMNSYITTFMRFNSWQQKTLKNILIQKFPENCHDESDRSPRINYKSAGTIRPSRDYLASR